MMVIMSVDDGDDDSLTAMTLLAESSYAADPSQSIRV